MRILMIKQETTSVPMIDYGMGVIATILDQNGHKVNVIDNNSHYKYYTDREILKITRTFKPDLISFTMTVINAFDTYSLLSKMKAKFPNTLFVGAGIHMRYCFEEALRKGFDVVVNREGEKVAEPLFRHLQGKTIRNFKEGLDQIPGISYLKQDGMLHVATKYPVASDLDEVPFVNYDLFNLRDFFRTGKEPAVIYINGQRGCPYRCTFCSDEIQRQDKRIASADYMYRYVEYLYNKYGIEYVNILDNNFLINKQRVVDFCQKMIRSGMNKKVVFVCGTKLETAIDEGLISLLKEAGCWKVGFGLERLDPYSLSMIKKKSPRDRVDQVFNLFNRYDIKTHVYIMTGFPFETVDLVRRERQAFSDIEKYVHTFSCSILMPTPGTIYYDDYSKSREWYLRPHLQKTRKSYYEKVLELRMLEILNFNFFDLPKEVIKEVKDYYLAFKKKVHGQEILGRNIFVSIILKMDIFLAEFSRAIFSISPSLEFWIFRRIKSLRYYFGTRFFGDKISNKNLVNSEAGVGS